MINKLIILVVVFCHFNANSQSIPSTLMKELLLEKKVENVSFLSNGYQFMGIPGEDKETNNLQIVKHRGGIVVAVEGTNRIYKIDTNGGYTRLDKTSFSGFNFGASIFSYKDTLYSIGGYGFWNTNGSIRFFNETTREWDIIRNIQDVPFANGVNGLTYFDSERGKLHLIYNIAQPEYKKVTNPDTKLYYQCFNFKNRDWLENPIEVNPAFAKDIRALAQIQKTSEGVLCTSTKLAKPVLLDFEENKIFEIDDKFITQIVQMQSANKSAINYITDQNINIYNFANDSIIHMSTKNLKAKEMNIPIYLPTQKTILNKYSKDLNLIISILLNLVLIFLVVYFVKRNNSKKETAFQFDNTTNTGTHHEFKKGIDFVNNLSILEKELLETIVRNNLDGKTTTVTQINKVLGTEKKSFKIQNNIRGEFLTLINNKFIAFSLINDNLIERQRSEFDKRHMEYFINEKYIGKFPLKIFVD
jgi:hypothetical protein